MRREASTHFRPECVQAEEDRGVEPPPKKTKKDKKEKAKSKEPSGQPEEDGPEPPTKKTKKEKKRKTDEEEGGDSEASSLPW